MAINNGSRYQDSIVDYFRKEEYGTTYPVVLYQFDTLDNINYFIHNYIQGEMFRQQLENFGIKASLATTTDGPRILVWPGDESNAKTIIKKSLQ